MKEALVPPLSRPIPAGILIALAAALVLWAPVGGIGCGGKSTAGGGADSTAVADSSKGDKADSNGGDDDNGKEEKATTVNAAKVVQGDLVIPVVAEGAIRARHTAEIQAKIEGQIERLAVQEGQTVKKGQLIAKLDDREYKVALDEARNKYLQALGKLAADEETLDSPQATDWLQDQIKELDRLETEKTITHAERRDRELALEVEAVKRGAYRNDLVKVRSGLADARADQQRAELNLEDTEIRAPFSGVVSNLTLTAGERVGASQLICNLVDNTNLEAAVSVLESDLKGLETGREAILTVPAVQETLRVHVDVMSPQIDKESRTCELLMRFESDKGHIRPGMFARAEIAGQIYPDRILVPREAILTRDNRPLLFKVVGDHAEWVYITPGLSNDTVVEVARVLQGGPLDPGTPVVVSDHLTLTHMAKVKIRKMQPVVFAFAGSSEN
jgi:membrane fusion protein (multidrug efflux system)